MILDGRLEIDSDGRIWRIANKMPGLGWRKIISCDRHRGEEVNCDGYYSVHTRENGIRYGTHSHRLVWYHFRGEIPEGLTINHINGIKTDNRLDNLELATYSQQHQHALNVLGIRPPRGEEHWRSKFTEEQIRDIRLRASNGEAQRNIARDYRVGDSQISNIIHRLKWAWLE